MPGGIASCTPFVELQSLQRKLLRRRQIAGAMLVMYRQRLDRFSCDLWRTGGRLEQPPPTRCGKVVLTPSTRLESERP